MGYSTQYSQFSEYRMQQHVAADIGTLFIATAADKALTFGCVFDRRTLELLSNFLTRGASTLYGDAYKTHSTIPLLSAGLAKGVDSAVSRVQDVTRQLSEAARLEPTTVVPTELEAELLKATNKLLILCYLTPHDHSS